METNDFTKDVAIMLSRFGILGNMCWAVCSTAAFGFIFTCWRFCFDTSLQKAVMGLSQFLYVELLSFLLDWCQCENDEDTFLKTEQLESMRECLRSILGVCGIYRMTEVVAEAWVVLTGVKLHGADRPIDAPPVPIAGAAPSPVASDLCHIQWLPHASILEEELISALDLLEELQCSSELLGSHQVGIWLRDLRFVVATAHFIMVHRMNRDA